MTEPWPFGSSFLALTWSPIEDSDTFTGPTRRTQPDGTYRTPDAADAPPFRDHRLRGTASRSRGCRPVLGGPAGGGRDAISEVPADRWDVEEFFDSDPDAAGKMVTRRAGFVDDVTGFDAPFFGGVSAREANLMDPQHRLLLETSWRAVEHSGTAPTTLANTRTGVFVGLATHDFLGMASDSLTYPEIEAYLAVGTSSAAAAGRISYRLGGLQGPPAVTVDTACSSSLVAIHQACQALLLDECDLALAGGVNVMLSPATMITFSHSRMLAP